MNRRFSGTPELSPFRERSFPPLSQPKICFLRGLPLPVNFRNWSLTGLITRKPRTWPEQVFSSSTGFHD